jgi:hypothetical protein
MVTHVSCWAIVVRRLLAIVWSMSGCSSGWAARVITTVVGDIGGSRLLTSWTRRGVGDSAGEMFDMLVEVFEDIWMG